MSTKRENDQKDNNNVKKKLCIDISSITCPITKEIFCIPVIADDGFTYEKWAIDNHIQSKKESPMTRQEIKSYINNVSLKNIVKELLDEHSELKSEQFDETIYYNFAYNKKGWEKALSQKNFVEFSKFSEIHLLQKIDSSYHAKTIITYICEYCTDINIFKTIISKSVDTNCFYEYYSPIHYVANCNNKDIIMAAFETNMDIANISEKEDENIIKTIHNNKNLSKEDKVFIFNHIINSQLILKIFNKTPICLLSFSEYPKQFDNSILNIISDKESIYRLIDINVLVNYYFDRATTIIDLIKDIELLSYDIFNYYKCNYKYYGAKFISNNIRLKKYFDEIIALKKRDDNSKKIIIQILYDFYKKKINIDIIDNLLLSYNSQAFNQILDIDKKSLNDILDNISK